MRERGWGRIVVISSGAAKAGLRGRVAYSASKANAGHGQDARRRERPRGITASALLPGMVATEEVRAMPDEVLERLMPQLPSGRMVEPAEIAATVGYLCADERARVTGQEIAVDGGAGLALHSRSAPRKGRKALGVVAGPGDLELAADVLGEPLAELVEAIVESPSLILRASSRAPPSPSSNSAKGARRRRCRGFAGAQLAGDHGADVGRDQCRKRCSRNLGAKLGE